MAKRDLKPDIQRLEELAISVRSGDIKLPKFQRAFVWKEEAVLDLFDSIYKSYPIGSLLIWNSSQRLNSERSILGLKVNTSETIDYPTNYLLDGQQRLTSLCGVLYRDDEGAEDIWKVYFDLEKESFVYPGPRDKDLVNMFPMNKLIDTGDFIHQCMKYEHHPNKSRYISLSQKLLRSIKDYKIAVVMIGDMTVEQVAPIFERINSAGRKLTIVDLMMAATWTESFDLNEAIAKVAKLVDDANFGQIESDTVLRSIAAAAGKGVNKEDIESLRNESSERLNLAADVTLKAYGKAIDFFDKKLGVLRADQMPYNLQLLYIVEFFRINPNPSASIEVELVKWFWSTSFTRYLSGANSKRRRDSLETVRDIANGDSSVLKEKTEIDITELLFDKFSQKNSTSKGFRLLVDFAYSGSRSNLNAAFLFDVKDYPVLEDLDFGYRNLNISRVAMPGRTVSVEKIQASRLKELLLSPKCLDALRARNSKVFIKSRAEIISRFVEEITGCDVKFEIPKGIGS